MGGGRDRAAAAHPAAAERETRRILDALRRILRFVRNANATSQGAAGIGAAQLFVLQALADAAASVSVNTLADLTYADQSTVSVMARKLEAKGLVLRRRADSDRRRVEVTLTPRGRRVLRRGIASPQQVLLAGIRGLPQGARSRLAGSLPDLLRSMGLERAPAPMMFADDGGSRAGSAP